MTKRLKTLLILLAVVIVIAGIYLFATGSGSTSSSTMGTTTDTMASTTATTTKSKTTTATRPTTAKPGTTLPSQTGTVSAGTPPTILWSFHDRSNPHDTSALFTAVSLTFNSNLYDLGTLAGVCKTIPDTDLKFSGEISGIQCLNDGKGEEVGIFKQGAGYVLKQATLTKGLAGKSDTYGTFTVLQAVK